MAISDKPIVNSGFRREDRSANKSDRLRWGAAGALASLVFLIDTLTSITSAVAIAYVLVIVMVADITNARGIKIAASICAFLSVASFLFVHTPPLDTASVLRLVFSLSANAMTTLLAVKRSQDQEALEIQARLLEMARAAIFLRNEKGIVIQWSRGAELLYGVKAENAVGRPVEELFQVKFPGGRRHAEHALYSSGHWEGELEVSLADGRRRVLFSRWRLDLDNNRTPISILETAIDISERKAAELAIQASEARYRTIFQTLAVAIWEHDFTAVKAELVALRASGVTHLRNYLHDHPEFVDRMRTLVRITDVNQTALKLLNFTTKEQFHEHLGKLLPDNDESFAHCLIALDEERENFAAETIVLDRQGNRIPVIIFLNFPADKDRLDRIQGSAMDVRERLEFEAAKESFRRDLEQAARVAMVGEISASIAHEVNQPLAAITTFVNAAQSWLKHDPPNLEETRQALNDAVLSVELAADVIKRVRILLGNSQWETADVAVDAALMEAIHLRRAELTAQDIRLVLKLDAQTGVVVGDKVLLQQAFLNIISNAIHAITSNTTRPKTLTISTLVERAHLKMRFEDSGTGLGSQLGEELFKPFRSTKTNGMGLGLAMCRSIVSAHHGTIIISNAGNEGGAVVEIDLPCKGNEGELA